MPMTPADKQALEHARYLLEHPGLAARLSHVVGAPIERGIEALPPKVSELINDATRRAIQAALNMALRTMDGKNVGPPANRLHKLAVMASGATGGAFGLAALALELPVTTTIMMRSIADVARSQGEDLSLAEARLECLHVLALGGRSSRDDASETGYFTSRAALAQAIHAAAQHISAKGVGGSGAPAVLRLLAEVSARFSITVSEKAIAQSIPVIGALGAATLNVMFIHYFQDIAQGHFTVRRLERIYGPDEIKRVYTLPALRHSNARR